MAGAAPKYSMIAARLLDEIQGGRIKVGELLPTESRLMRDHGVSRYTVRSAIRELRVRGVVSSRQGRGSVVVSDRFGAAYVERIHSLEELIAFGSDMQREVLDCAEISASQAMAERFGWKPGRKLLEIRCLRKAESEPERAVAVVTLWMDSLFKPAVETLRASRHAAVAEIIRERFGYSYDSVTQTVQAGALEPGDAGLLGASPGDPALVIEREYARASAHEPHLVARSICLSGGIRIVSHFKASPLQA